jgi:hypothetical protein
MNEKAKKEFAASIKPAVRGVSDKFSWRLYQRALKRGRERVYISAWNNILGIQFEPDLAALKAGDRKQRSWLMIGEEVESGGWFHGSRIQSVVRKGMQRVDESFAFSPAFNTGAWLDITEWFWSAYLAKGRCIIHGDQSHDWQAINRNARKCRHCGEHQRRSVVTVKSLKRLERWQ